MALDDPGGKRDGHVKGVFRGNMAAMPPNGHNKWLSWLIILRNGDTLITLLDVTLVIYHFNDNEGDVH